MATMEAAGLRCQSKAALSTSRARSRNLSGSFLGNSLVVSAPGCVSGVSRSRTGVVRNVLDVEQDSKASLLVGTGFSAGFSLVSS